MATNVLTIARPSEVLDERDILLTRPEAAAYLRKSVPTLERWAREGIGPKPVKIGRGSTSRVHYRLADIRLAARGEVT